MISITPVKNTPINFGSKQKEELQPKTSEVTTHSSNAVKKVAIPTLAMLMYMNAVPAESQTIRPDIIPENNIEMVQDNPSSLNVEAWNKTQLGFDELFDAPSPEITVNGKKLNATIVVDTETNKLYRYNDNGELKDGYHVATGVIGKSGKSITGRGIRQVDHKESYPYKCAPGSKRSKNPKAYGPKILYLTVVNPKTGAIEGSTGEFIHGNNNPASIGKHASHGCIRMDNEVIKKFAEEVPNGSYVLIK